MKHTYFRYLNQEEKNRKFQSFLIQLLQSEGRRSCFSWARLLNLRCNPRRLSGKCANRVKCRTLRLHRAVHFACSRIMLRNLVQSLLRQKNPWAKIGAIALLILAAALGLNLDGLGDGSKREEKSNVEKIRTPGNPSKQERKNGYEVLSGVALVDHRNNDGDSFFVRHEGREFELRLYYVDTPEKYLSREHADQRERVREQGEYFELSTDQAVTLGKAAKAYVLELLGRKGFTVYTKWDRVYGGERFHGFVEITGPNDNEQVYLSELLVRKGLARIHTHGEPTPDGRHWRSYKDYLRSLEAQAKKGGQGGWGL